MMVGGREAVMLRRSGSRVLRLFDLILPQRTGAATPEHHESDLMIFMSASGGALGRQMRCRGGGNAPGAMVAATILGS